MRCVRCDSRDNLNVAHDSLVMHTRYNKQINLNVRQEFEIPAVYTKGGVEEIEEALLMGATIQHSIRVHRSHQDLRKWTEEKDAEIQRIQHGFQEKMAGLTEEIAQLHAEQERVACAHSERLKGAQKAEREFCAKESEEAMRLLKKEHDGLVARHDALEMRRRALEEGRSSDIQEAVARAEVMMGRVVAAKEEQLGKMEVAYGRLQESIVKQGEEIAKLSSTLGKRAANVKTKGNDYEEHFGERLRAHYGLIRGFSLKSTGLGAGHQMDFEMGLEGNIVLFELKSYGSLVPKAEVEKFLRDLKENPQASIGVFISRTTDVHGKQGAGPLVTEFDGDKMMIYINRFEEWCGEEEHRAFSMLLGLFRIWWEYHKDVHQGFDRVELIRELEKAMEEVSKRRLEFKRHRAHLEEVSRWTADVLDESEERLDRVLKKAKNVAVLSEPSPLPEGVFRESGEQKEALWTASIMRVCVGGGEIEVRELVELLKSQHKLSSDTIRSNVMSIVLDSAVIKHGIVKHIRGISKAPT